MRLENQVSCPYRFETHMKNKIAPLLFVFLPLIGCDRITKDQAVTHLKGQDPIAFIGGIFKLTYHENSGAMLSLGAHLPDNVRHYIFTILVGLILAAGLIYLVIKPVAKVDYILGLVVIAGGLGNLHDRIFNDGKVVDFMLLAAGPVHTGVFNVADIALMVGLFGFIFISTKWGKQLRRMEKTF